MVTASQPMEIGELDEWVRFHVNGKANAERIKDDAIAARFEEVDIEPGAKDTPDYVVWIRSTLEEVRRFLKNHPDVDLRD